MSAAAGFRSEARGQRCHAAVLSFSPGDHWSPGKADFDDHKLSLTLHYTLPCRPLQDSDLRLAASVAMRLFFPFRRETIGPRAKRTLTTINSVLHSTIRSHVGRCRIPI